ncbi:DUF1651 domain-containing protein [Synechococcus sp. CCY 0621]|uniref:DUF1651 domain-containing protein n=1 Tax=Synechococcus sp. CCY 0621 TaxID=2815603 RepID=UPI00336A8195
MPAQLCASQAPSAKLGAVRPYCSSPMDGWLRAPDGRNALRFHRDPAARTEPLIFIDLGELNHGEPALLKRWQRDPCKQAVEQWNKLQKERWTCVVDPHCSIRRPDQGLYGPKPQAALRTPAGPTLSPQACERR